MCNVPVTELSRLLLPDFPKGLGRVRTFLYCVIGFLVIWFLLKPLSWGELIVIIALLAVYLIFECGGPVYVFVWLCRAFKDWLGKPSVCRKCGFGHDSKPRPLSL